MMRLGDGALSAIGGRRLLFALGAVYLSSAISWPLLAPGGSPAGHVQLLAILTGGSGLAVLGAAYWLPRTDLHPDSWDAVGRWCLGAIGAMLAVLLLVEALTDLSSVIENVLILTALASIAGLGIGLQNAKAYTRALNAEAQRREVERYNRELQRYETIVETVRDGIFVVDQHDRFTLINHAYAEMVGYDRDVVLGSHASLVVDDIEQLPIEDGDSRGDDAIETHETTLETRSGEMIQVEATVARLSAGRDDVDYVGVVRDVTERNERKRELERANRRLKASNERLEQFAYAASHDLQEPLRMISSYLTLIEQRGEEELTDETEEFLEYAIDGADRMRAIIDGLLQYSRIETQGDPLEPVDLDAIAADVRDDLEVKLAESDAELCVESLPTVTGDEAQLRRVFQNLVSNAIEYSGDEPARIRIDAERGDGMWTVSVCDRGIGIDPEHQDSVFEVFQSLHPDSEHSGSGIGLALCERIVERHGGEIWVDSAPGEGSSFSFTLPAADS